MRKLDVKTRKFIFYDSWMQEKRPNKMPAIVTYFILKHGNLNAYLKLKHIFLILKK